MTRILVVTAVDAERTAVLTGLGTAGRAASWHETPGHQGDVDVITVGVGPAAAGAGTAAALATAGALGWPYSHVLSLGIGGGLAGRATIGDIAVGTRSVAADLGAESDDGFLPVAALGFGQGAYAADPDLAAALLAALPSRREGSVLTVCTVTGTTASADALAAAHPDAVAEAMEGFGVAAAADLVGVPFVEIRTISNMIGPRDRDAWRIGDALAALSAVGAAVGTLVR